MTRVLCLGDVMVDVLAHLPTELAIGSDTPAPISLFGGGSAANTAAWLVTAGVPTTFVGRVGDDALGRTALAELEAAGISLAVSVDPLRPTGMCIVLVDAAGERTMIPSAGANAWLDEAALPTSLFTPQARLHVSAYALFAPGSRRAVDAALALAAERNCAVSIDAASAAPLRSFGVDRFLGWLPRCLLFANLDEAAVLTGTDDSGSAAERLADRCGEAIVKCGERGAVYSDGRQRVVELPGGGGTLVDSTGAGDAFAAGVLAARAAGDDDPRRWLRAGNALAARAIAQVGGRPLGVGQLRA